MVQDIQTVVWDLERQRFIGIPGNDVDATDQERGLMISSISDGMLPGRPDEITHLHLVSAVLGCYGTMTLFTPDQHPAANAGIADDLAPAELKVIRTNNDTLCKGIFLVQSSFKYTKIYLIVHTLYRSHALCYPQIYKFYF